MLYLSNMLLPLVNLVLSLLVPNMSSTMPHLITVSSLQSLLFVPFMEVRESSGGAPTLLSFFWLIFVDARLVYLCRLCLLLIRGDH